MKHITKIFTLSVMATAIAACGGSDNDDDANVTLPPIEEPVATATPTPTPTPLPVLENVDVTLTTLGMLVNTNDGFTGVNAVTLADIEAGSRFTLSGMIWDAGTEANTESAGTMPGPADRGTGFDAARDDSVNSVRIHAGVLGSELETSVLGEEHRFDQPAMQIRVNVSESASADNGLDLNFTLVNLTNAQPISPALVLLHESGFSVFEEGEPASVALEDMAEGGSTANLETIAGGADEYLTHTTSEGAIPPKGSAEVTLTLTREQLESLSN